MREANVTTDDAPIRLDELQPVTLGEVSAVTGSEGGSGTDRDSIIWGNEDD
jgi:hypothetical protein